MKKLNILLLAALLTSCSVSKKTTDTASNEYREKHRLQFHFSPKTNWSNDPNGMFYLNGQYHLFFQHHPHSINWGPMHWGHAVSKDLMHWKELPIALYPDSLGYIFSGSTVVDYQNTSGFGQKGKVPIIAIFTHHNMEMQHAGRKDFEYQSIAYSLDEGRSWTKYERNPVLKNPEIPDFRDPKVFWHEESSKWIMALAARDRVMLYSSPDLKSWSMEREAGKDYGAHSGTWECPDMFSLEYKGEKYWVLMVSVNSGGPNGGSGIQYFIGDFDGKTFKPHSKETRWLEYGTDNYAGVTFSNTGSRKVFMGWMTNLQYGGAVPAKGWRGAMTFPRELELKEADGKLYLASKPVVELKKISRRVYTKNNFELSSLDLSSKIKGSEGRFRLDMTADAEDFSITVLDEAGEELLIGYEASANQFFVDRTNAGESGFNKNFAKKHTATRISASDKIKLTLLIDAASAEVFADEGLTVFSEAFFPSSLPGNLKIAAKEGIRVDELKISKINSVWR